MGQPGTPPTIVRFGLFEVDLVNAEIRKAGLRLRIQEQPFQILTALLDRPGEVVRREDLVRRLWPEGTFVDFDRGLNAAVARLRQLLQDSAETPRYIETVARRGYRFIAPVLAEEGSVRDYDTLPVADLADAPSRTHPRATLRRWVAVTAAGIALIVIAGVSVFHPRTDAVLEQITRDSGLATEPALSPDGKLVAYASDRGGTCLNIWVKQLVAGGTAIQLTHDIVDSHQPSFSPDGSKIAYRSERDGGSIFVIPAIGGEPVKLAAEGRDPRFSPDGAWITYWAGIEDGSSPQADAAGKVYIISTSGGEPKRVGANLPLGGYPVWSADSKRLLVYANPRHEASAATADWWVVPLTGDPGWKSGAFGALQSQGFSLQFASALPRASAWLESAIIFSAQKGDTRGIWQVPFRPSDATISGAAEKLTNGTTLDVYPASNAPLKSRFGSVAFASLAQSTAIWSVPVNSNDAKLTGELRRLTDGDMMEVSPSISADGRVLAYGTMVPGREDIWSKDLQTGMKSALASTPAAEWHPVTSRDGSMVAYTVDDPKTSGLYVVPVGGGKPRRVGPATAWIFDWAPDKQSLLYHLKCNDPRVKRLDLQNGTETDFLQKPGVSLFQSRFSPDGKWVAFEAVPTEDVHTYDSRLFIVGVRDGIPLSPENWILIGDEHGWADKPRWSPDGNTLYFISHRDGFRCIWAQRLHPDTKRPVGELVPIYHFHSSRISPVHVGLAVLEMDVVPEKIVISLGELTGNIWSMTRR